MSAEILREAALLMRERAEGATSGPWVTDRCGDYSDIEGVVSLGWDRDYSETNGGIDRAEDAEHIASWSPVVALAVADWLVLVADGEHTGGLNWRPGGEAWCALEVARAYLGRDA